MAHLEIQALEEVRVCSSMIIYHCSHSFSSHEILYSAYIYFRHLQNTPQQQLLLDERQQREDLFAALDEVTEIHMSLKDELEEARAAHDRGMVERAEAEAECKEVREMNELYCNTS
jgi:hypothetical protein